MRKNAHARPVPAVPDREGLLGVTDVALSDMVHEPRLVPAVAPGPVLDRLVAYRGPETRRVAPRCLAASEHGASDLAVAEGVAPMFNLLVPAGGFVEGEGDVADDEDPRGARPHRRVGDDTLGDLEARLLGEPCTRHNAGRQEYGPCQDGLPALDG